LRQTSIFLAVLFTLGISGSVGAQTPPDDTWQVTVAPYLMGASISGETTLRGRTADVDVSNVLSHLQFGAMGILVARKGNWGFGADLIWMALGATTEQPSVNVDFNQGAFAFYGLRRLGPAADLTFGLRINVLQGQLGFKGPLEIEVEQDKNWVDPVVGLNLRSPSRGRLHAGLYTEIGGFGLGSNFAWQIFPTLGIRMTEHVDRFRVSLAGYRLRVGRGQRDVRLRRADPGSGPGLRVSFLVLRTV
jgi:hypothetical protein